jgi:SSS family solute:Na+ symporter
MLIAIIMSPQLKRFDQAFQFIQEFTGLISPGVVAIFLLGMFWKRASGTAALVAAILTLPLGIAFNEWMPQLPFLSRMGIVFGILVAVMIVVSLFSTMKQQRSIEVSSDMFSVNKGFAVGALLALGIISALYIVYW